MTSSANAVCASGPARPLTSAVAANQVLRRGGLEPAGSTERSASTAPTSGLRVPATDDTM